MEELHEALTKRFGKSLQKRIREFNALRQSQGEQLREYYDRVQRAA
jgi:hypothetical protein